MSGAKRAKRQQLRGAIALVGPSGSGKTLGALLLAYGMMKAKYPDASEEDIWEKVGLIDTEHERALVYEGMMQQGIKIGQFWHYGLEAPYSAPRFEKAFNDLVAEGVEVIVVDSTTHAWEGEGGVLDYQQELGGRFQDWNSANKEAYAPLVRLFTGEKHKVHVINTMRTKQEYTMGVSEKTGKPMPIKVGTKPVQRDSFEYEFQVVFNVDMDHNFSISKDNSGLFEELHEPLAPEHGKLLFQWLEQGVDIFAEREAEAQRQENLRLGLADDIVRLAKEFELVPWLVEIMKSPFFGGGKVQELDMEKLNSLRKGLQAKMDEKEAMQSA